MRRMLVAVDGSEGSERAAAFALEIARAMGTEVVFLHVGPGSPEQAEEAEELEEPPSAAMAALERAASLAGQLGVPCESELAAGETAQEIADAIVGIAAAKGAEMIVVGSRGYGPIRRAVLGSVSREVLGAAEVPVLVVKGAP